jgi:pimeloyl-ACP methyl ester carboxylesterase
MTLAHEDAVITWNEAGPAPLRGTLVLLPGRGESPDVYERFGRRLAADAYRVHVVTAPSESAELAQDQLVDVLGAADAGTPRIVVGSDAGAAFAAHLAATSPVAAVSALILSGLPTTARGAPAAEWGEELDLRTSCPTHRARISDSGVHRAALFTDLPSEWLDPSIPGRIQLPVLGLHGQDDVVSLLDSARRWYRRVPRAELVSITGGRHDALNDQTHRTVAATIELFLERLRRSADVAPITVAENLTTENLTTENLTAENLTIGTKS